MSDKKAEVLTGKEALSGLIPPEDMLSVKVKTMGELKVGDYVEGVGRVIRTEEGKAPAIQTTEGEITADNVPLDYPVSVVASNRNKRSPSHKSYKSN
jgi:hypothetical protein